MSENNERIENGSTEAVKPVFSSNILADRDFFCDFSLVNWGVRKNRFTVILILSVLENLLFVFSENDILFFFSYIIPILMAVSYFGMRRAAKLSYERNLLSYGKEPEVHVELYENKIVTGIDESKVEYSYDQITGLYETNNLLLLHLKYNLHISVNKNSVDGNINEVKAFLLQKCPAVKKKKFVNCVNNKKWVLALLIMLFALYIIATAAIIALNI